MSTPTTLLLAEIDRRAEWARTTQMGVDPLAIDTLAYLTAFREIVRLHTAHTTTYIHQDGTQNEAPVCNICDCEHGDWPCHTVRAVTKALGVEA